MPWIIYMLYTLKLPFRSQLINSKQKLKMLAYTYIITNASYEEICVVFERKKQHNIGFVTFSLSVMCKHIL